jgi:hypothetical protein
VEHLDGGEFFGSINVPADNARAIARHSHDATMLPVCDLVLKGQLLHAQKVFSRGILLGRALDLFYVAGPEPFSVID